MAKVRIPYGIIVAVGLLLTHQAWSAAEFLPGSVLPEQVGKALSQSPDIMKRPKQLPVLTTPEVAQTKLGEAAKKIHFQLNDIILEGNTVFTKAQLLPLYKNKLHKSIPVSDLFVIIQDITNYYRNNGYILSRAILPPQHVSRGVVHVRIIEGYIDKIEVAGNPHRAARIVKAYGKHISAVRPLQIKNMEHYLLLANQLPATRVKAVLSPSKTQTGAADLALVTDNRPFIGYISYDNYGTRYIGPQQITANLGITSFLISGDIAQGTYIKTPKGKELNYTDLNYNVPISSYGLRLILDRNRTHTDPLFVLQPTHTDGQTDNYSIAVIYPAVLTRTDSFNLRASFGFLNSTVKILEFILYRDHLRPLDLGFTYSNADRFFGANVVAFDFWQGLPIFGATSNTSPDAQTSRLDGHGNFTKVNLFLSRLQALPRNWYLFGQFQGQYAFTPLLAAEQFAYGGSQLGRAYDVAELIGDRGIGASMELRYDYFPQSYNIQLIEFYAFYDAGIIWNILNVPGAPQKISATSAGFGARFFLTKVFSGNIMWAQPLSKQVAAEALIGKGWHPRVFFSVVASW